MHRPLNGMAMFEQLSLQPERSSEGTGCTAKYLQRWGEIHQNPYCDSSALILSLSGAPSTSRMVYGGLAE